MSSVFTQFFVAFAAFMVIDLIWLGLIAKGFYNDQLGELRASQTIWPAAVAFYILFVVGLVYFAINPGLDAESLTETLRNGALYGFFTYMTYELTNYAVIEGWPRGLVLVDIVWGIVLATSVSWVTYLILS